MHGISNLKFKKALTDYNRSKAEEQSKNQATSAVGDILRLLTERGQRGSDIGKLSLGRDGFVYREIGITMLELGNRPPVSLFITTGPGTFQSIYSPGSGFHADRIAVLENAPSRSLHILEEDLPAYLSFNLGTIEKTLTDDQQTRETKVHCVRDLLKIELQQALGQKGLTGDVALQLVGLTDNVVKHLSHDVLALALLIQAFKKDDKLFRHSVTVSVLSILLARQTEFCKRQDLLTVGLAGLLHDFGLMQLNPALREKDPKEMTPEEWTTYSAHPTIGAEALKAIPVIPSLTSKLILQHHERPSGTGYPNGLLATQIHPLARILSIADHFNDLTTSMVGRRAHHPMKALDVMNSMNGAFDPQLLFKFTFLFFPKD